MQVDNSNKQTRKKQQIFWQLTTLSNLHSLTQTILHHQYPQLHTATNKDWSYLFFLKHLYTKGIERAKTFISESAQYVDVTNSVAFDRVSLYQSQLYQRSVQKSLFWGKVYDLNPVTKEGYQSRRIVRGIVWRERYFPYFTVVLFATVVNAISGIALLSFSKRMLTFAALFVAAQLIVRVRQSDNIFYSIPPLPDPQLESQRQALLRKSLVIDGRINSYDRLDDYNRGLEQIAMKEQDRQEKKDILEVLGYIVVDGGKKGQGDSGARAGGEVTGTGEKKADNLV